MCLVKQSRYTPAHVRLRAMPSFFKRCRMVLGFMPRHPCGSRMPWAKRNSMENCFGDSDAPQETSLQPPVTQAELAGERFDTCVPITVEQEANGGLRDGVHRVCPQIAE